MYSHKVKPRLSRTGVTGKEEKCVLDTAGGFISRTTDCPLRVKHAGSSLQNTDVTYSMDLRFLGSLPLAVWCTVDRKYLPSITTMAST